MCDACVCAIACARPKVFMTVCVQHFDDGAALVEQGSGEKPRIKPRFIAPARLCSDSFFKGAE